MNNISISSDNYYAKEAVKTLLSELDYPMFGNPSVSIFIFDKNWVSREEFLSLMLCQEDKVLIIGSETVLSFLEKNILIKSVYLCSNQVSINTMKIAVAHFLYGIGSDVVRSPAFPKKVHKLSSRALTIMPLYLAGIPLGSIAKSENINAKTLYSYKSLVMKEKGLISDFSLVNHWEMVLLAEIVRAETAGARSRQNTGRAKVRPPRCVLHSVAT